MAGDSILTTTKKLLGMPEEYTVFDEDIIVHINSSFATLNQLGVGPKITFEIKDKEAVWATFIDGNPALNGVRQYVYQKAKLVFDPPQNSFVVDAITKLIAEHEFRLLVAAEEG